MAETSQVHLTFGEGDDELARILREAQLALLRHPVAALALAQALILEGRDFSKTEEGQEWSRRLANSALIRRGRLAWETTTMNAFEDSPPALLPSQLIDAWAQSVRSSALEAILAGLAAREEPEP